MDITIIFSLFSDPLRKQLESQNIKFENFYMSMLEKESFHAMSLRFHELISDSQADEILFRIRTKVEEHISLLNNTSSN